MANTIARYPPNVGAEGDEAQTPRGKDMEGGNEATEVEMRVMRPQNQEILAATRAGKDQNRDSP